MLESYWYIACRSDRLRRRPRPLTLFGRALVLYRDRTGRATCLEDRCAHRNMPLSAGCVVDGQIQCPYHGWRYDADGCVAHIPAMPTSQSGQQTLRIPSYPVIEQDGYVWVSLAQEPAIPTPPRFPRLGEAGWRSFRMRTRAAGSVEAWLENFLDCPHTSFVHGGLFRSHSARPMHVVVRERADGAEAEFFEQNQKESLLWRVLRPNREPVRHIDRFVAPAMSHVEYHQPPDRHYFICSACTPITERETEIHTVVTYRHGWLTPFLRVFLEPFSRYIMRQDVDILRRQQANIDRFGGERYRMIPQDLLLPHIRRWRRALAAGETPDVRDTERKRDIVI